MRFQKCFSILIAASLLLFAQDAFAQRKSSKKKDSSSDFKSRLWYGGGLALGFNGFNGGNVFSFGLSPMVGYKITPALSVGPRVSFLFSSIKVPRYKAVGLFDVDAGAFVRVRVFRGLFIQGEASNEWYHEPIFYSDLTTGKEAFTRFNTRLGAGWNFSQGGGGGGSEIGIFYNFTVANDLESYQNPLEYRFGFTWNF